MATYICIKCVSHHFDTHSNAYLGNFPSEFVCKQHESAILLQTSYSGETIQQMRSLFCIMGCGRFFFLVQKTNIMSLLTMVLRIFTQFPSCISQTTCILVRCTFSIVIMFDGWQFFSCSRRHDPCMLAHSSTLNKLWHGDSGGAFNSIKIIYKLNSNPFCMA